MDPQEGFTVDVHVRRLLDEAQTTVARIRRRVDVDRRIRGAERERLWRELAGVVSACETVRLWLAAGAPRVEQR